MIPVNVFLTAVILSHWNPSFPPLSNFTPADIESREESLSLFDSAAQEMDVPTEITQAIARVESNGTPYALNVEGKGYFFDSKEEALAAAAKAESEGRSFDSGIMQINNWWLKRFGIPLEAVFDPEANILLGSWILKQEMERGSDTWAAVGRYHSPNADRGNNYAQLVRQALGKGPGKISTNSVRQDANQDVSSEPLRREPPREKSVVHKEVDPRSAAPLVVYRGASKPTFNRTPADIEEPEQEPGQKSLQDSSQRTELVAQNTSEQLEEEVRVFVRRF